MLKYIWLGFLLIASTPVWSQAPPSTRIPLELPPPVTGQAYPGEVSSEARRNQVTVGVSGSAGWNDNVLLGLSSGKVSDEMFSIAPLIGFDKHTPRINESFDYNAGFTFYRKTSDLNEADHNASGMLEYRFTQHSIFRMQDFFQKSSNIFSQPFPVSGGPINGSTPLQLSGVIPLFADRILNTATVNLGEQISENSLIGAEGSFQELDYPNRSQAPGLFNSNSVGASGFYFDRLNEHQYVGFLYQYLQILTYLQGAESEIAVNSFSPFYTFYLARTTKGNLTASVMGGPEHYSYAERGLPRVFAWAPSVTGSLGWQGPITNLAGSFSRTTTGGGGLNSAFDQTSENFVASWRMSQNWTISGGVSHVSIVNKLTQLGTSVGNGDTTNGSVGLQHKIGRYLQANVNYYRMHQAYPGIAALQNPDSDQVTGSVTYLLTRPVGR